MYEKNGIFKVLQGLLFVFALFMILPQKARAEIDYVPLAMDNSWVAEQISQEGEIDFYSVSLQKAGWLTVDYQGLGVADSYMEIWDYDLTNRYCRYNVYTSSETSPKNESARLAMEPGSYVIKIYGESGKTGSYRVRAGFQAANNNESTDNDSFVTAQKLSFKQKVNGFLSSDDKVDFYKIQLNSAKTIRLIYTSYIRDSYIQIWDKDYIEKSNHNVYWASEDSPLTYLYEEKLSPGTYYIKIYPAGDDTGKYTLKYEEKILAKKISVSGNKKVVAGKSFKMKASVSPSNTTDKTVEWSSGDSGIATVDRKTGKVTTYSAGKVNITVSAQDGSNAKKVIPVIVLPKKMSAPSIYRKSGKTACVNWYFAGGVSGYEIQYSTNKSFKGAKTKSVSKRSTSANITKLSRKKYYVRIRGYVKAGKKYYGAWSKSKTINMKK